MPAAEIARVYVLRTALCVLGPTCRLLHPALQPAMANRMQGRLGERRHGASGSGERMT